MPIFGYDSAYPYTHSWTPAEECILMSEIGFCDSRGLPVSQSVLRNICLSKLNMKTFDDVLHMYRRMVDTGYLKRRENHDEIVNLDKGVEQPAQKEMKNVVYPEDEWAEKVLLKLKERIAEYHEKGTILERLVLNIDQPDSTFRTKITEFDCLYALNEKWNLDAEFAGWTFFFHNDKRVEFLKPANKLAFAHRLTK